MDAVTFWTVVGALGSWCAGLTWWVVHHHASCHSKPLADAAALTQRVAGCEEKYERLARNAHDDRGHLSRVSLWVEVLKERAGVSSE